jgi:hypothetical protein
MGKTKYRKEGKKHSTKRRRASSSYKKNNKQKHKNTTKSHKNRNQIHLSPKNILLSAGRSQSGSSHTDFQFGSKSYNDTLAHYNKTINPD